ncbi:hypothetical protein [Bacillus sp. FSL K6-3431]|uniref:hypothetical protein n=1 Tax=Bacillus sp. FSL K6-3431 TaxID=2921500 RepID=UPI0030F9B646
MLEQKQTFSKRRINGAHFKEPTFNVYLNDMLVAEVRGNIPNQQTVIPMRELNDYEEDKLHEYIASVYLEEDGGKKNGQK